MNEIDLTPWEVPDYLETLISGGFDGNIELNGELYTPEEFDQLLFDSQEYMREWNAGGDPYGFEVDETDEDGDGLDSSSSTTVKFG